MALYDTPRREVNTMKDLLLSQTTKECKRLNSCGDALIDMLHNNKLDNFDKASIAYLNIQFNNLQEIAGALDMAILNSYEDRELLLTIIPYINDFSFMVASFTGKIMELKEII